MPTWYASVNFGLESAVAAILAENGARTVRAMDSAVVYEAQREIPLGCINNQFLVLASFHSGDVVQSIEDLARKTFEWPELDGGTFRVVVMDRGKLVAVPPAAIAALERNVAVQTGLMSDRANPDIEIWLNRRSTGETFFMVRTHKHASFEHTLQKGELRPDIVDVMLRLAGGRGVLLDPFGGSGAIAYAAAQMPGFTRIYTGDIDAQTVEFQINRLRGFRSCIVREWDAARLPLEDGSVDAVVTDPPWGEYRQIDRAALYDGFVSEAARVLKPGGALVFLSSAVAEAEAALGRHGLAYTRYDVKIAGKNARLYAARVM